MKLWMINRYFIILSIEKIINYVINMFKQITPTLNMFLADLIFNQLFLMSMMNNNKLFEVGYSHVWGFPTDELLAKNG